LPLFNAKPDQEKTGITGEPQEYSLETCISDGADQPVDELKPEVYMPDENEQEGFRPEVYSPDDVEQEELKPDIY